MPPTHTGPSDPNPDPALINTNSPKLGQAGVGSQAVRQSSQFRPGPDASVSQTAIGQHPGTLAHTWAVTDDRVRRRRSSKLKQSEI